MEGAGGHAPCRGELGVSPRAFSEGGQAANIGHQPTSGT